MLTKHILTLAIAASLAGLAHAAPLETKQVERIRAAEARMQEEASKASNPDAPAPLPIATDIPLAELERRWALGQAQTTEQRFTSAIAPAALSAMAQQIGCQDIVGVQPMGFPMAREQPTVLNGGHLLARCPDRAYLTISAMSMAGKSGNRASISPQSFDQTVDGKPARRLYYKAPNGRQQETLTVADGDLVYMLAYWSHDDAKHPGMAGERRLLKLSSLPAPASASK